MADTTTSVLSLTLPAVDVEDLVTPWGTKLNANFSALDSKWTATAPSTQIVGAGVTGSSLNVARADHVHPMAQIVNADISSSAAIAYSKLSLANSITNNDIGTGAAIGYTKLALTGTIVNGDINASAAIAYSKLSLSGSIVNADIGASAAIARTKLAALSASLAMVTNVSGFETTSAVTSTELGFVSGVTSAIQTQLNSKLGGVNQPPNIAINGGMEIWQRGSSFSSPANGVYTADRWRVNHDGTPTFTISQETTTVDKGLNSLKLDITAISGSPTNLSLRQVIENGQRFNGTALTLSVRVKCSVAGKITCALADDNGSIYSSANVGTGWETLSCTISSVADTSSLNIFIGFVAGSGITPSVCTTYIDSVMVVTGSTSNIFIPDDPAFDLMRCMRYFQIIGSNATNDYIGVGQAWATTDAYLAYRYPVPMRAAPTATVTGATNFAVSSATFTTLTSTAFITTAGTQYGIILNPSVASGLVAGNATAVNGRSGSFISLSAEL
jgi:hypothetical protein